MVHKVELLVKRGGQLRAPLGIVASAHTPIHNYENVHEENEAGNRERDGDVQIGARPGGEEVQAWTLFVLVAGDKEKQNKISTKPHINKSLNPTHKSSSAMTYSPLENFIGTNFLNISSSESATFRMEVALAGAMGMESIIGGSMDKNRPVSEML